ncbi:MAG: putative secreted protein [Myxococcales bacterium]|nr:putative secreted protein [Myxococcales bacterium]
MLRPSMIAFVVLALGCSKDQPKKVDEPTKTAQAVAVAPKKPVPTTPLPPLAADRGGATGKPVWATGFGGLGIDAPRGIALDADGNIYICGYFDGEIDFGPKIGKKPSAGGSDAFVAKLDPTGKLVWAQTFGAKRDDAANAIAVRGDTVVVVGNFLDEIKIGEFTQKAIGSDDLFVAAFDRNGVAKWTWRLGGIDSDGANAVAGTPDGGWVIGGSFKDSISLGSTTLKSKGDTDALLAKLAPSGDLEWMKQFGGAYKDTILHVAVDANGNIYVQGHFADVSDWGGKPLKAAGGSDNDVVLAKYDTNGDHKWSQRFGYGLNDAAGGVAVDPAGHVTMVGSFDKTISFGEGDQHASLGEADAFIARFTTEGKLEWARTFGAEREDIAWGVAVDTAGNSVTTGWFQQTVDFGKGPVTSKGNKDVFALKLDPKGATMWVQSWGDHDHDQGRGVALDDKGNSTFTGIYRFKLAIAEPPLESTRADTDRIPKPDVYVVRLER